MIDVLIKWSRGAEAPTTFRLQPHPTGCSVTHIPTPGRAYTNIARVWSAGDSGPDGRCRLCPECTARDGLCLVSVGRHVPRDEAPLFSLRHPGYREMP